MKRPPPLKSCKCVNGTDCLVGSVNAGGRADREIGLYGRNDLRRSGTETDGEEGGQIGLTILEYPAFLRIFAGENRFSCKIACLRIGSTVRRICDNVLIRVECQRNLAQRWTLRVWLIQHGRKSSCWFGMYSSTRWRQ